MAKPKTTENKPLQVPAAELVGDHAKTAVFTGGTIDGAGVAVPPVPSEAADDGSVVTYSTEKGLVIDLAKVGTEALSIADGTEIAVGIDLADGGSILTAAVYRNGVYMMDVQALELADLISIIAVTDDDEKREILKALQAYLMWSDDEAKSEPDHAELVEAERDSYRKQYPSLSRIMDEWKSTGQTGVPTLRIVSKIDGFWRAGIQHTIQPVELSMANLTPDKAELLLSENTLIIELI